MYAAEFFEHAQQVYSLTHFYMCWMPISLSSTLCVGLSIELLINVFATNSLGSQDVRARLILRHFYGYFLYCIATFVQLAYISASNECVGDGMDNNLSDILYIA